MRNINVTTRLAQTVTAIATPLASRLRKARRFRPGTNYLPDRRAVENRMESHYVIWNLPDRFCAGGCRAHLRCQLDARTYTLDCGGRDRAGGARDPDGS